MLNNGLLRCGFEGFIMDLSFSSPEVWNCDLFARVFVGVHGRLPLPVPRCGTMTCLRVGFRVFSCFNFIPVLRVSSSCLREVMVLFGHYLAADSCFVFGEGRGEGVKR